MKILIYPVLILVLISCESGSVESSPTGKSGSMARFAIIGDRLYTVSDYELSVFDISVKGKTVLKSQQYLEGYTETIFAKDSLLFFGTRQGMMIYDNTNKNKPEYISTYEHIYSCDPVVVNKNIAFVTLNSSSTACGRGVNRLDIIDISDLKNPTSLAEHAMISPKGLGIDGDVLFVCDNGLKAFHLDDFNKPQEIAQFDVDAYDVIPDNGYLILIGNGGFHQYKYTDRALKKVSSILVDY